MRYKNIELPDAIKAVEMLDFHFNTHMDGKITFEIHFEEGVLPEVFPEARARVSRTAKTAAPVAEPEAEAQPEEADGQPAEPEAAPEESGSMERAFHVTGVRRKELVAAISEYTGAEPKYKAAPSFAYEIGAYTVDKEGTLTGPVNLALIEALQRQGFTAAE